MSVKAILRESFYMEDLEFGLRVIRRDGSTVYLLDMIFEERPPGSYHEPLRTKMWEHGVQMREIAQAILDSAWEAGLRPSGFTDVQNETAALKYHLEDMRSLVFTSPQRKEKE